MGHLEEPSDSSSDLLPARNFVVRLTPEGHVQVPYAHVGEEPPATIFRTWSVSRSRMKFPWLQWRNDSILVQKSPYRHVVPGKRYRTTGFPGTKFSRMSIMHWVDFGLKVTRQSANYLIQSGKLLFLHYHVAVRYVSSNRLLHGPNGRPSLGRRGISLQLWSNSSPSGGLK